MPDIAKMLIIGGVSLAALGLMALAAYRLGFRGLPGDISYQGPNVRFYFPIVTCIVFSILLTAGICLWRWLAGK